jgi:hypothetical protein
MAMKRFSILFAMLALTVGCSDSSSSPSQTANPTFSVDMRPSNEVPPVSGDESSGSGSMTITFIVTRDSAGNISAASASFVGTVQNFPAGMTLTAAHIHPGAAGVNGSPLVNLALSQGQIVFANGSGPLVINNITVLPEVAQQIINNPAGYYFNIHTAAHPAGVARGQLVRVQ